MGKTRIPTKRLPDPDDKLSPHERNLCIEMIVNGKSLREAYCEAYNKSEADNYCYALAAKPKIVSYCDKLRLYVNSCLQLGSSLKDKASLGQEDCLQILSSAANGDLELTSSRARAIDMLLKVFGAYGKNNGDVQQNVNISITGLDDEDKD